MTTEGPGVWAIFMSEPSDGVMSMSMPIKFAFDARLAHRERRFSLH